MANDYVSKVSRRFWAKVNKQSSGCWEWTAHLGAGGYGAIKFRENVDCAWRDVGAHRVSWWLTHGKMPTLYVLHRCDNPKCVNPDHLFLGTAKDNLDDMWAKGRANLSNRPKGENHPYSSITNAQANQIRLEYSRGGIRQTDLAEKYGISQPAISRIILGLTYRGN